MKKNDNLRLATLALAGLLLMGAIYLGLTEARAFLGSHAYAISDEHFAILMVTILGGAYGFIANKVMKIARKSKPAAPKS